MSIPCYNTNEQRCWSVDLLTHSVANKNISFHSQFKKECAEKFKMEKKEPFKMLQNKCSTFVMLLF